ncbi:hypothetical protein MKW94_001015 [Papaver nudicaule]|uniref:Cation/H+ exchanger transmembrane domain-containing protein n=1 Tax=Papaver nudicaule TaxID=74823 RepID=A0AA41RU76_PAPNU|nr:hypothetical protein [Papaver nudicaule]
MMEEVTMMSMISPSASNSTAPPGGGGGGGGGAKEQQAAGVGILLQIMMLVLSFVLGHLLRRHKFYFVPEASASLLIGLIVGGLANVSNTEASIRYLGGVLLLMYKLPFVECLMFGALISATDPVTVLSIFQELGTDMNLYALVFGESVLNDAMAISLYRYMLAEGLGLSGIVSILFTGIVMKHYTFSNLSENSQRFVAAFFHLISSLAETFVFIYMGFDIAMEKHSWSHVGFIFFSILFIVIARAANVFSCGYLINMVRPANRQIPSGHQKALWYSGLRGAMAFALALQSVHDLPEGHGQTIFTATTAIVVLTVLLIGGSTGTMLGALHVVGDGHDDGPLGESFENSGYIAPSYDEGASSGSKLKMKLKEFHKSTASFTALDKNYLTPFFTTQGGDSDSDDGGPGLPAAAPSSRRNGRGFRGLHG